MKRILPLLCALLLLTGCADKVTATGIIPGPTSWQEQYDLGLRFLSDGNYKEAVIHFTAAIRIDPKQADAYRKAAEAYGATGDIEEARAILQQGITATGDASLQSLLDALPTEEDQNPSANPPSVSSEGVQLTLSLTDPALQDAYLINKPESAPDAMEYCWFVAFTDGINSYEVGTSYFKLAVESPRNASLHEMQSNLWLKKPSGGATWIAEATLDISGTDLSWTFVIPAEYNFDSANMKITGTTIGLP